jgi:DNA-binding NarL/FixJ family response regulator
MHVILADSNDLVRVGLRAVLNSSSGYKIVGEARDNEELLDQVSNFGASLVVIDYTAPGFDIDVIPKVLQKHKGVKFLAITPDQSAQTLVSALRSGVTSYVKKDCDLTEIQNAVTETFRSWKQFNVLPSMSMTSISIHLAVNRSCYPKEKMRSSN